MRFVVAVAVVATLSTQAFAGLDEGATAYNAGNYALALQEWLPLAKKGDAAAQYNLGLMYRHGEGVEHNDYEAAKWYRMAGEQGFADAQVNLGILYISGQGVEINYVEAAKWFRKAALQGNPKAMFNLGLCYEFGNGVKKDQYEAVKWYGKAADLGFQPAKEKFGKLPSLLHSAPNFIKR